MKITKEISLYNFEAWSGANDTLDELTISECDELEAVLEDLHPDGMDETQLNDILWFENDWIAECLGYRNWEHLVRDHEGITEEDHARTIIKNKFPNATDELIDGYIDEEWTDDMDDEEIIDSFKDYREQLENEEE